MVLEGFLCLPAVVLPYGTRLVYVNQPKALLLAAVISTNAHMNRTGEYRVV
jgi:hypothetical protein